jgi:hypothetical protein
MDKQSMLVELGDVQKLTFGGGSCPLDTDMCPGPNADVDLVSADQEEPTE